MRKLLVVLPVYNEEKNLPALLAKIGDAAARTGLKTVVVAVDDGSRDSSAEILSKAAGGFETVRVTHPVNKGLRETMRDGYEAAARISADDDVIVTMDADDTQDPAYVDAMIRRLDEGFDVVIASRYRKGSTVRGVPSYRQLFSTGANLLCRVFLRIPNVRDYACGFRAFRGRVVRECVSRWGVDFLEIKGYGFICAVEAIVKASAIGARFSEIPFELRYDLKAGASKMRAGRTIMGYFVLFGKSRDMRRRGAR